MLIVMEAVECMQVILNTFSVSITDVRANWIVLLTNWLACE